MKKYNSKVCVQPPVSRFCVSHWAFGSHWREVVVGEKAIGGKARGGKLCTPASGWGQSSHWDLDLRIVPRQVHDCEPVTPSAPAGSGPEPAISDSCSTLCSFSKQFCGFHRKPVGKLPFPCSFPGRSNFLCASVCYTLYGDRSFSLSCWLK